MVLLIMMIIMVTTTTTTKMMMMTHIVPKSPESRAQGLWKDINYSPHVFRFAVFLIPSFIRGGGKHRFEIITQSNYSPASNDVYLIRGTHA